MVRHNPPHPGEVMRGLCLAPLGLSVTEAAEGLGVSRRQMKSK
jgi:plasmid maintenance system antidote protein VapI